ncbi:MAG: polysulfide reductase NrfD [SAR202 cluster bacterium]|nr:polysulfide reductase NrfD [SAR202 cluster bacterium]
MEPVEPLEEYQQRLEDKVLSPLTRAGPRYYLIVGLLLLVIAWGLYAYVTQYREGLYVTGMRDRILWGLYVSLFIFFIGISQAGTLISAILRLSKAQWRVPITRMAELITVAALLLGALLPVIDQGRPDRVHFLLLYGRWQSPIIWDIFAISTYTIGSLIYLYLPLIPDLALARDKIGHLVSPPKRWFFRTFSLDWRGTARQKRYLIIALGIMMVLMIPVAVSAHTVVSLIFATTLREPWDNPMFGAYFVAGAIYSGTATIVIVMAVVRKAYGLEEYITRQHFINLGYLLGCLVLVMMYFNVLEFVTNGYKLAGEGEMHFQQLFTGTLAPYYWSYALGGMLIPGLIILFPWTRNIAGVITASVLVNVGMWIERYFIVVGGMRVPIMPYEPASYFPTWVEWSIMAAAFAAFTLIIVLAMRLLPIISIWEVSEQYGEEKIISRREAIGTAVSQSVHPEYAPTFRRAQTTEESQS